jgi:TolB protein
MSYGSLSWRKPDLAAGVAILVVAAFAGTALSPPARAAFPGMNGKIAFARDGDIWVMNPDGGGQTNLTTAASDGSPAWSADGTKLAFVRVPDGIHPQIFIMNADGSGQTRLTNNLVNDGFPSWSPDGTKIAFIRSLGPRSGDLFVMNANGSGQTNLTNNVPFTFPDAFTTAWSPDGTKIAFSQSLSDTNTEIYLIKPDGSGKTAITSNGVNSGHPNWSPDGAKITFDRGPAGSSDIYTMNPDGSGQTNLTNNGGQINGEPAWSPDGTKIVFDSFRTGDGQIFVMNADGSGQTQLTSSTRAGKPDWGPIAAAPKHPTSTSVSCSPPTVVAGQLTTCTATVTDTATSGQTTPTGTVSFTSTGPGTFGGGGSCTLATASSSSASCSGTYTPGSTPANPVRTDTITASYTGDSTHDASSGTTQETVISPTALASGSFVIGDLNATVGSIVSFSDVEWWGSNWWKRNSLSGGPAPAAFKGFAESSPSPPTCGENWTTGTGNSSGPPATVPGFMAVIAASKITQSGSVISGNAPEVVVVRTNPGYAPNPGHVGTGTVVAIVCGAH